MRIGFKLFSGYVFILAFMGALVFLGVDGERTLSRHYDSLLRLTQLENNISLVHKAALAGADKKILLTLCDELLQQISTFDSVGDSNEAAVIRRTQLAAQAYKERLEKWVTIRNDLSRYIATSQEYTKSIGGDSNRISSLLSVDSGIPQGTPVQEKAAKRAELLATVQKNVNLLKISLLIMEATGTRDEYENARAYTEEIIKSTVALRGSMKNIESMVLDRSVVTAKSLDSDILQIGVLYNGLMEAENMLNFGLSNANTVIRQYADSQRDGLATVREAAIIPGIAVVAGAVIIALLFWALLSSAAGKFTTSVSSMLKKIASGKSVSLNDADSLPDDIRNSIKELWDTQSLQLAALSQLADGDGAPKLDKEIQQSEFGIAIDAVAARQNAIAASLKQATAALDAEKKESLEEQLVAVTERAKDVRSVLAQVEEQVATLKTGADLCKSDLSLLFERVVEEFSEFSEGEELGSLQAALEQTVSTQGTAVSQQSSSAAVAKLRAHFNEIERAVKILGWQVSSYEDFARQLETLAINVNVEAARVGAGTTAMSTIVEEIRLLAEKCRKASEASEKGKTVGIRSLDAAFSDMRSLDNAGGQAYCAENNKAIEYAAAVCKRATDADKELKNLFASSLDIITRFTVEAEKIISATELVVTTKKIDNDNGCADKNPIALTAKVASRDERMTELPELDL